jgi:uncharacterized protein (UPF0332 family)
MNQESAAYLRKAEKALRAAEILLREQDADSAAGRAYYAMLHIAQALLRSKELRYRKHSGAHAAFGEHFAKTSILDPKYHRWMLAAFNNRLTSDYDIDVTLDLETVSAMLEQSREFLVTARDYLSCLPESAGSGLAQE